MKQKEEIMKTYKNLNANMGVTRLTSNARTLTLTHAGNMGASMADVEQNVDRMDIGITLASLLKCPSVKEDGHPDYYYTLTVPVKELI